MGTGAKCLNVIRDECQLKRGIEPPKQQRFGELPARKGALPPHNASKSSKSCHKIFQKPLDAKRWICNIETPLTCVTSVTLS